MNARTMNSRMQTLARRKRTIAVAVLIALVALASQTQAQEGESGSIEAMPAPRERAPIDVTGLWVAIVNEDWRWRMVTPAKGDYSGVMTLNPAGRDVADSWDETQDGSCKAYGAGGLLRMPTRLRIRWESDSVLKLETDAGEQMRLLNFDAPAGANSSAASSLQGSSVAQWHYPAGAGAFSSIVTGIDRPEGDPVNDAPAAGSLEVMTTNLSLGWLRRNGVPYSEQTTLTEHFDRFGLPNGDQWLVVTTIVDDPVYHTESFITSSHFKREADNANWNPTPCASD